MDKQVTENFSITPELRTKLGEVVLDIGCNKSELLRTLIRIGLPILKENPSLVQYTELQEKNQ